MSEGREDERRVELLQIDQPFVQGRKAEVLLSYVSRSIIRRSVEVPASPKNNDKRVYRARTPPTGETAIFESQKGRPSLFLLTPNLHSRPSTLSEQSLALSLSTSASSFVDQHDRGSLDTVLA